MIRTYHTDVKYPNEEHHLLSNYTRVTPKLSTRKIRVEIALKKRCSFLAHVILSISHETLIPL